MQVADVNVLIYAHRADSPERPGPDHWAIFESLVRAAPATGKLVADA